MVIKQVTKLYVNLLKLFRPIWNTWDLYLDGVVEEFVLIYEDMDRYQAFKHLEILQEQIDQESIYWKDDKVKITMTFGLADSNEYNDLDELINLIDDNLYRGKKEGRNRIVFNTLK